MAVAQDYHVVLDDPPCFLRANGMTRTRIFELDGFIAGILLRHWGRLAPGEWLPHVWGACGEDGGTLPFEAFDDMQRLMDLVRRLKPKEF